MTNTDRRAGGCEERGTDRPTDRLAETMGKIHKQREREEKRA